MTGRKPPGVSWEGWTERLIREGIERGEFDDLPGRGRPLAGLDEPRDELWWVRDKLRREELDALPPSLALRRDRQQLLDNLAAFEDEAAVRATVEELNASDPPPQPLRRRRAAVDGDGPRRRRRRGPLAGQPERSEPQASRYE